MNNLNREFDDEREEAKWEKKKSDMIAKVPETKELFDLWRRDREITNRIGKRNKAYQSRLREYNVEMRECDSRIGLDVTRVLSSRVRKGPRVSEPRDDGSDGAFIKRCFEVSGVTTPEELLELLARIRELKEGQLQEVEVIKDVEKVKALLTEKKRKFNEVREGVSSSKSALYEPTYVDLERNTPKPGKREREEMRTKKVISILSSFVTKLRYDSPNGPCGSNR
jgi:hypothetical protein